MSLTWQKQLLFKDYSRVGGQERKKRKIPRWIDWQRRAAEKNKAEKEQSNQSHISVCKPVNLVTGVAGKYL